MRFTIFGGRGFIGRSLVDHLKEAGHEVVVPERDSKFDRLDQLGHVIYAIGLTADFRTRPFDTIEAHVSIASHILRTARFESFLYLSSTRIYGKGPDTREDAAISACPASPSSLYDLSKMAGEAICLNAPGPNIKVVRLSNVVGPNERAADTFLGAICREAAAGHIHLQTAPLSAKDYIWIDDVLDVIPKIAVSGRSRIYNVASGRQTTHQAWCDLLAKRTGCWISVAPNAPDASFAPISVERLRAEFGAEFRDARTMADALGG